MLLQNQKFIGFLLEKFTQVFMRYRLSTGEIRTMVTSLKPSEERAGNEIVVSMLRSNTACSECGRELGKGNFLRKEGDKGLCLECADLDHLEFLPSGDAAVTRRATKYSSLHAVVVQWSRTRKRYERQGILAEPEAVRRAEEESLADADFRAWQRA